METIRGHLGAIRAAIRQALRSPITLRYPDVVEVRPEGYRGFILFNPEKCVGCSLCAQICPARAIKMYRRPPEKRMKPGYDLTRCIFCGLCVDVCPHNALETSWVQDIVFESVEEMRLSPEEWAKFSEEVRRREEDPGAPKVRPVIDEERGVRYERL